MSDPTPSISGNPAEPKNSALAIWSLALGILSLICCSIFAAIPGVICGHMALSRIKSSGGALLGRGMAISGLVTGYIGVAWAIIFIPLMFAIAVPNFIKAREKAQENICINNLRDIAAAKEKWVSDGHQATTNIPTATDLLPYLKNGIMPSCPAGGTYTIGAVGEQPTCSLPGHKLE
jgi:hypothetical protein